MTRFFSMIKVEHTKPFASTMLHSCRAIYVAMNTMAERIKLICDELERERGMTRERVATALNVSKSAVSKWEGGQTKNLKNEHLFLFEDRFGYSARWIATGQGPQRAADVREVMCRDYLADKLTSGDMIDISALPPEAKSALEATVDAFVGTHVKKKAG
ncbi:helix-turn-helix domain-containing protein [Methylolobus aquaticus]